MEREVSFYHLEHVRMQTVYCVLKARKCCSYLGRGKENNAMGLACTHY